MLRKDEGTGFEHEDASAARGIRDEQMLCDYRAERATADDDDIEIPPASADRLDAAVECLRQSVAEEAAHIVQGERRRFGCQRRGHRLLLVVVRVNNGAVGVDLKTGRCRCNNVLGARIEPRYRKRFRSTVRRLPIWVTA